MRKIDRFDKYMEFKGLNDNRVTNELGLSVGTLGKSRKEGRDLSKRVVEQILNFYTDLNKVWLETGISSMLLKDVQYPLEGESSETKPRIPTQVAAGSLNGFADPIVLKDCEQIPVVKMLPYYDYTIVIKGDSMEPKFEGGDEIAIRKVYDVIEWGHVYVLDTRDGAVIKRLFDEGDKYRCSSYNKDYPDFYVNKEDVFGVYKVVGLIRI